MFFFHVPQTSEIGVHATAKSDGGMRTFFPNFRMVCIKGRETQCASRTSFAWVGLRIMDEYFRLVSHCGTPSPTAFSSTHFLHAWRYGLRQLQNPYRSGLHVTRGFLSSRLLGLGERGTDRQTCLVNTS